MRRTNNYIRTNLNPAGFIEQRYVGLQTPKEIIKAIGDLKKFTDKLSEGEKPTLILVDLSRVTKVDISPRTLKTRVSGIDTMRSLNYERAAVYGPLAVQILTSTLALVAGVHKKIRVFDNRTDAVSWLRAQKNRL